MKHVHYTEVECEPVQAAGAEDAGVRWLISSADGAEKFHMRRFELRAGGCTPFHSHPWEHELYILAGKGVVRTEAGEEAVRPGDAIYMPGGEEHCFVADEDTGMAFLCLVPREGGR
jgi:quercetin dioxygenase-like cupin family protein